MPLIVHPPMNSVKERVREDNLVSVIMLKVDVHLFDSPDVYHLDMALFDTGARPSLVKKSRTTVRTYAINHINEIVVKVY